MIALDRLAQIVPPDMALGSKGVATALQQIPGVSNMDLPGLAVAFKQIQGTSGLPIISAFTSAVPPSVAAYYINTLAQNGTGPNGTTVMADFFGTAEGWNETAQLTNTVSTLDTMNLANLGITYQAMSDTVNGVYGDPITGPVVIPTGPVAGTYDTANDAFWGIGGGGNANANIPPSANTIGLIGWSQSEIANTITLYPAQVANLNAEWTTMAAQVNREIQNQAAANLVWGDLTPNDRSSVYGLIYAIPNYGTDTQVGGAAQLLESVATQDQTGEAIIGTLRQGRNQPILSNIGISLPITIPDQPQFAVPQANLSAS